MDLWLVNDTIQEKVDRSTFSSIFSFVRLLFLTAFLTDSEKDQMIGQDLKIVFVLQLFEQADYRLITDGKDFSAFLANQMMMAFTPHHLIDRGAGSHIGNRDLSGVCHPLQGTVYR